MKWFHHECASRIDPKLRTLCRSRGLEGLGAYWSLLEEVGAHSDTFHLKIVGGNRKVDGQFSELARYPRAISGNPFADSDTLRALPRIDLTVLAADLYTSPRKLRSLIVYCVKLGLFDARKWLEYNVLHSPAFERRGDDYTRRVKRNARLAGSISDPGPDNVRTLSDQSSPSPRKTPGVAPDVVPSETETGQEREEEKNGIKSRTDKAPVPVVENVDNSGSENSNPASRHSAAIDESYLIDLTEEALHEYSLKFHSTIDTWKKLHPDRSLQWDPNPIEMRRLFCHGEFEYKMSMCFHAYKLLGDRLNYPELVLRALRLMLRTHVKANIANPYGWMFSCLHGSENGAKAWVHLLTAEEEKSPMRKTERSPQ